MKKKTAAEIFGPVDPNLTVISGRRGSRGDKRRAKKLSEVTEQNQGSYNPQPMTEDNWRNSEGDNCPVCGQKTLQLFPYGFTRQRQACRECIDRRIALLEYKARVAAPRFRR